MRNVILVCLFLGFGFFAFAQEEKRPDYYDDSVIEKQTISEEDIETYKSDEDFDYTEAKKEENFLDRFVRWLRNILTQFWEAIFGVGTASGFIYFVFRILPYILLAVLIYLLVRFFLKVNSNAIMGNTQGKGEVIYSEEEQIIKNEDVNALIKEAVRQKNFRLAIRYYYLLSLKYLTEAKSIEWQPQKTNEDYIKELKSTDLRFDFENITKIYDYVWYGEFAVNEVRFESLKLPFESLHKSIKN
ncbi:MAG: DUF4129 domain-containing protein [Winogradskyella sp.]|uniref:DUF4129 domain-containing protein n=1 Tax=Winogradskyella sp. TaxID=1883156 RepID=UPI000F3B80AE|nr:DUF4129 domain-containing protein [Winogradskyella sp.]RNC80227.1 MAG: DUF4129 domain-containing protein [Winogradskyella sp.]